MACFAVIVGSMPASVYATVDTFMLAAFAEAWSIHKRASLALQAQPLVLKPANGQEYQNPWLAILNGQARIMATIGSRLGLNPAARMRARRNMASRRAKLFASYKVPETVARVIEKPAHPLQVVRKMLFRNRFSYPGGILDGLGAYLLQTVEFVSALRWYFVNGDRLPTRGFVITQGRRVET
jgi:P27 family predicted phage terminase small subunit